MAKESTSIHASSIRMLVLEVDEPHPDTVEQRGTFGQVFDQVFKKAGDAHDPPLGISTIMRFVVEEQGGKVPTLEEVDEMNLNAILITGSMYDAHGGDGWILKLVELIQDLWVHRPDIRFSGVCFGHQILCRALGSKIESTPDSQWELAHTTISLSPIGRQLFQSDSGTISLHQMHQDHVINAPSHETTDLLDKDTKVHVWGSTDMTPIQGVYIRERLFTTQGHLGFDEGMVRRQIGQRVDSGSIKQIEVADEAANKAHLEHDGEVVAGAILRFFHGDDRDVNGNGNGGK